MAEEDFDKLNETVWQQLEEILSSNGEQLSISILERNREILDVLAAPHIVLLLRDPSFRELIYAWHSVIASFPLERSREVLLGIILATLYERTKQSEEV